MRISFWREKTGQHLNIGCLYADMSGALTWSTLSSSDPPLALGLVAWPALGCCDRSPFLVKLGQLCQFLEATWPIGGASQSLWQVLLQWFNKTLAQLPLLGICLRAPFVYSANLFRSFGWHVWLLAALGFFSCKAFNHNSHGISPQKQGISGLILPFLALVECAP